MDKKTYSDAFYIRQQDEHAGQAEEFNAFVTNELSDASLAWTKEELNKTPEDRKEIA